MKRFCVRVQEGRSVGRNLSSLCHPALLQVSKKRKDQALQLSVNFITKNWTQFTREQQKALGNIIFSFTKLGYPIRFSTSNQAYLPHILSTSLTFSGWPTTFTFSSILGQFPTMRQFASFKSMKYHIFLVVSTCKGGILDIIFEYLTIEGKLSLKHKKKSEIVYYF